MLLLQLDCSVPLLLLHELMLVHRLAHARLAGLLLLLRLVTHHHILLIHDTGRRDDLRRTTHRLRVGAARLLLLHAPNVQLLLAGDATLVLLLLGALLDEGGHQTWIALQDGKHLLLLLWRRGGFQSLDELLK